MKPLFTGTAGVPPAMSAQREHFYSLFTACIFKLVPNPKSFPARCTSLTSVAIHPAIGRLMRIVVNLNLHVNARDARRADIEHEQFLFTEAGE